jgi:hypothetical protein
MNFILFSEANKEKRHSLSKLGFNVNYIRKSVKGKRIMYSDIVNEIDSIIVMIYGHDNGVYYDICFCPFLKKETLFKNIWIYRNNVYPTKLVKVMACKEKKDALIQRLQMIKMILSNNS